MDAKLFLIVGSDTLVDLHTWHKQDLLLEMCEIVTFIRPGEDSIGRISEKMKLPAEQQKRLLCNVIDAHRIEISSTEIRMRIARGKEIRYLVPPSVEAYIEQYNLYQG